MVPLVPSHANSYTITSANGSGCAQSETARSTIESGVAYDTDNRTATISIQYTHKIGKRSRPIIVCDDLYQINVKKQQLDLDKAILELELLKAQLQQVKDGTLNSKELITNQDDW